MARDSEQKPHKPTPPANAAPRPKKPGDPAQKPRGSSSSPLPKSKAIDSNGHKEISWVRASTVASAAAVKVGSIFFRTKDHQIDDRDRGLIQELARAYARHAAVHTGADGISGSTVGYADPRPSRAPDNT